MLLMRETASQTESIALDPRGEDLAHRINRLEEPYRSNTIEWLERMAGRSFEDLERDLPRYLGRMQPGAREMCVDMLNDLLGEALHYFGRAGRSRQMG